MPLGGIHQTAVQERMRPGLVGMPVNVLHGEGTDVLINKDPQAVEIHTYVIDTATNDATYGIVMSAPSSRTVEFTADGSATKAEVCDGYADAWNADAVARGFATAVSDGVDTVTITGGFPGIEITLAEGSSAGLTTLTNTQDAALADPVKFGRGMVQTEWDADQPDRLGILAKSSALVAQIDTLVIVFEASERYSVDIDVEGTTYKVEVAADTNTSDTVDAIFAAINAAVPANTVIASASGGTDVVITSELAGRPFKTSQGTLLTQSNMVLTNTLGGVGSDINVALAGVSQRSNSVETASLPTATTDDAEWPPNSTITVRKQGQIWVDATGVSAKSDVYIELDGTGADAGKFFSSGGATRALVDRDLLQWERDAFSDSDADIAVLSVKLKH